MTALLSRISKPVFLVALLVVVLLIITTYWSGTSIGFSRLLKKYLAGRN